MFPDYARAKLKIPCYRDKIGLSQGLAQLVARTPGGREVASSILVAPTIVEINVILRYLTPVKRAIFLLYTQIQHF